MQGVLASCLCVAAVAVPAAAADVPLNSEAGGQPTRYAIIVTGGELLAGAFPDSHTHFLTSTLHPLGMQCVGSVSVADKPADIIDALRFACRKAPLVLVTGGLGPTDNDLTRETLAEFTGIPLREHSEVLRAMEKRLRTPRDSLRPNLRRQTRVPSRGTYLKNTNGTAVGLVFEGDAATVVALPGPPRELQPMVRDRLVPYLGHKYGVRSPGCSVTLRFVGLGQSLVDQTLEDHVPLPADVTLSSAFDAGRVDFTFAVPGDTPQDRLRLQQLKADIMAHLGAYVYAEQRGTSLEQRVLNLLEERGARLAIVDAGTSGTLASGLAACAGESDALAGAFLAPTEDRLRRLVGVEDDPWSACVSLSQRLELLAQAAADHARSQYAMAVSGLQRDANANAYVEVVYIAPDARHPAEKVRLRGMGSPARLRLATELLDRLRRLLDDGKNRTPPQ